MPNFNYNPWANYSNPPYQPTMTPQYPMNNNQPLNDNLLLIPIQNEQDVDLYPIESGRTVFFLNIKDNLLYMKTNSGGGLPMVLRKFHMEEVFNNQNPVMNPPVNEEPKVPSYVSMDEFNSLKNSFDELKHICEDMKTVVDELK